MRPRTTAFETPFYLVTGGTGSLGREVIPRLLEPDPHARAAVLIRGDKHEAGAKWEELCRYLRHYGHERTLLRIVPVSGDVERDGLGLAPSDSEWLRRRVTRLIHSAASIQLSPSLERARSINVAGTARVLHFAEACPRLERLAHVSTAYVAGRRNGTIQESDQGPDESPAEAFLNPYEQSKAEAERLVRRWGPRVPVATLRPGIIVGDSIDGHTCNFGTLYRPLKRIAHGLLRRIPGDPETRLDLVPVNYVATCVARLSADRYLPGATYHVTAGAARSIPARELVHAFARLGGVEPPAFVSPDPAARAGTPLAPFFAYLGGQKDFDDATLRRDLGFGVSPCPDPRDYLDRLLAFCADTDWGRTLPWDAEPVRMAA